MGLGEQTMKKWGYIASISSVILAVLTFVVCILTIVVLKSSVDISLKDNTVIIAIIVLIYAVATGALAIVSIINIRKADQLYLQVSAAAATGKIPIKDQVRAPAEIEMTSISKNPPPPPAQPQQNIYQTPPQETSEMESMFL